jgi:hypothetical protein
MGIYTFECSISLFILVEATLSNIRLLLDDLACLGLCRAEIAGVDVAFPLPRGIVAAGILDRVQRLA